MLRKALSFVRRRPFLVIVSCLVISCVVLGPARTGHALHNGAVHVGRVVLPVIGDLLWGAWVLACSVLGIS